MEYKIKIDQFEGPLDLLLHLIKQANIDIYDIKLEEITKQYLDYIKAMEELNLSIASDYLVMAAELIELKSRSLLPRTYNEETDEYEEDPREILIKKLIDYKQYKEITSKFKELEETRQYIFTKLPSSLSEYNENRTIKNNDVSISDLLKVLQDIFERNVYRQPLKTKVTSREISMTERINHIRDILKEKKKVIFEDLINIFTREYIIITFLSILEMAKRNEIMIKQDYKFEKIYLELRGCA